VVILKSNVVFLIGMRASNVTYNRLLINLVTRVQKVVYKGCHNLFVLNIQAS
jgi:hypothetical protein